MTEAEIAQEFCNEMVGKIRRRQSRHGKQTWRKRDLAELYEMLLDEAEELEKAIFNESDKNVRDECLDVANQALFIYDKLGGKDGKRK